MKNLRGENFCDYLKLIPETIWLSNLETTWKSLDFTSQKQKFFAGKFGLIWTE